MNKSPEFSETVRGKKRTGNKIQSSLLRPFHSETVFLGLPEVLIPSPLLYIPPKLYQDIKSTEKSFQELPS